MRIVVALGGNALLKRGEKPDAANQIENVKLAAGPIAELAKEHEVVLTHGNGPQIGVIALESASDPNLSEPYPFDTLGAETQGMIGYWLLQNLQNALPGKQVTALINQTLVDKDDPAFANPTKFIGEVYDQEQAEKLAAERGWVVKPDGQYFRRVVGSPQPKEIVEADAIATLLNAGGVVICSGGGGIPVVRDDDGNLHGVEAVIDKDLTAALLARTLKADLLIILTDVDGVYLNYGTPEAQRVDQGTVKDMREQGFAAGSMGPKVEAACRFVEATGGQAVIGRLEDAAQILRNEAGTRVVP